MEEQQKSVQWVVFGLATVVACVVVFSLWGRQGMVDNRPDPYWFEAMGRSLVDGNGFEPFGTLLHRRTPLYPFLIAGIYSIGGKHQVLIQLTHCLLFGGTAALAYLIGRQLFNERTGRLAGLACMVHPALLRYVPDFHLETTLTFFWTLTVWLSVRLVDRPSLGRAAAFGFVVALTSLTKAVMLVYPVIFLSVWWWRDWVNTRDSAAEPSRFAQQKFKLIPVIFVAMGVTIAPWTVRNYYATGGHFVPVSTGMSDAFLRGFVFSRTEFITLQKPPYTDGENEVNAWFAELCEAQGTVWEQDDLETDRILNAAARERLLADPGGLLRKAAVGIFTFWYEMTSLTNSLAAGLMALVAWLLSIPGMRRARREGQRVWLVLAPILYLNLLLAVLLSLGRYSVPILPCLMVMTAFGIDTLLGQRRVRVLDAARVQRQPAAA